MRVLLIAIWLGVTLAACQSATTPTAQTTARQAPTPTAALATEDARAAVRRYLGTQPDSALYVLSSATILDADASWQVLVPRTDWAGRLPNRARFEVDKQTGQVSSQPVK